MADSPLTTQIDVDELPSVQKAMRNVPSTTTLPPSATGGARVVPTLQLNTPSAGAPNLLDRLATREKESDDLSGQISQRYGDLQKQYQGAQESSSALKDLLSATAQRIQGQQMGPTKTDLIARMSQAMSKPTGLGGLSAALGNAAGAGADVHDQQRAAELQRTELMTKYGIDANQADLMSRQYGIQGSQAGLTGMQTRLNQANSGADRLATAYGSQQNAAAANAAKFDPNLAYLMAMQKTRGDLNGAGVGGGGAGGAPDPLTKAYANYQVAFPSPPNKASPVQLAQYNAQLTNIMALNPNFQQGNKAIADKVRTNFDINGQQGQKVEFLNNVFGHMGQYDELMKALQANGGQSNSPAINSMANAIAKQLGHPEITNVEAIQPLLADEIVKAMVPNAGTGVEREHQVAAITANMAPGQWEGKKLQYTQAIGTQMADLERQFKGSLHFMPKDFLDEEWNAKLSPEAQQVAQQRSQVASQVSSKAPVKVASRAEALALPPGTVFQTPDNRVLIR